MFRTAKPMAAFRLGEDISGLIAGNGNDGAGDADLRKDGDDPNDDLRLEPIAGGSIGRGVVKGVPGFDGAGEAIAKPLTPEFDALWKTSGGAGLFEDILLPGRSIL